MSEKKFAYLDCPTGIAGDMCLGALVSAGVPLSYLTEQLQRLNIADEYQLTVEPVQRGGQQAIKIHVAVTNPQVEAGAIVDGNTHSTFHHDHSHPAPDHPHPHSPEVHSHTRHLPEIEELIQSAGLPPRAANWSLAVFRRLAEAEGAVHGIPPEQVHFHEVGATDAIVDIIGTCLGLDWLNVDELYCSALPTGGGSVWAAHGRLPVPTPAVLKLWEMRQVPIYSNGIDRELVTPTGAAIVTTLAKGFGAAPPMVLHTVGLGAGSRDLPIPNILRLWLGEASRPPTQSHSHGSISASISQSHNHNHNHNHLTGETVTVLETQIDDLSPQAIGYVFEALLGAGALDVFTQPVGMKKCRPGVLLTVICPNDRIYACEAVLFRETTTLGIRRSTQHRTMLDRQIKSVQTPYGEVRVKVAWRQDSPEELINIQPEYEDCAQLARQHHLPWREVHRLALQSWYGQKDTQA